MKIQASIEEISDGKLYGDDDMVRVGCGGCAGCSDCCRGMGNSIILDPYDVYRLSVGLGRDLSELLEREVELNVVDGCILPNLKMSGSREQCCFLNGEGRCDIHAFRPGVCRLFPLGRYYEDGQFRYFLQKGACASARTKVKVSKWVDTPDLRRNREFVTRWHYLLNQVEELVRENEDDDFRKNLNLFFLKTFYLTPYAGEQDFYEQFEKRLLQFRQVVSE